MFELRGESVSRNLADSYVRYYVGRDLYDPDFNLDEWIQPDERGRYSVEALKRLAIDLMA